MVGPRARKTFSQKLGFGKFALKRTKVIGRAVETASVEVKSQFIVESLEDRRYMAAPTVTGLAPTQGTSSGGTVVTIAGANLTGATAVDFGSVAGNIDSISSTQILATSPAESAGAVDVTVTTSAGTSTTSSADRFTFTSSVSVAPTVTAVAPNTGSTAGGTAVTITGTNLTGATAVNFGGTAATNIVVNSSTQVTATSPAGTAGAVDVTVVTGNGTSTTSSADRFTYGSVSSAPAVTAVSPTTGSTAGGTSVTITGTNLTGATAVDFGSAAATNVTVVSPTQITATSPAGTAGAVDVTVVTGNGTSATSSADRFTYGSVSAVPTVTGVSPSTGLPAGGTSVTITGTNLTGATAVDFGTVAATNVTVISPTQITATSPAGTAGPVDVTVVTGNGTSATSTSDRFTYAAANAPTVTALNPTTGPVTGGTMVTITGTNLTGATAVKFGTVAATNVVVVASTEITATAPAGAAGAVDVTVTTANGTSAASSADQFTYAAVSTTPTVTTVSPGSGLPAGGTSVTITGTNLTGATAVTFGTVAATSFTVVSPTEITAVTPVEAAGTVNVTVTTPAGTTATSSSDQFAFGTPPSSLVLATVLPYGATDFVENPAGTIVYATVPTLGEVVFINESTLNVIRTVHVGTDPTGLAISADGSTLYVADHSTNNIDVVNTTTGVVGTPLTLPGGDFPTDVQVGNSNRLFVLVGGNVLQINATTGASAGATFAAQSGDIRITPNKDTLIAADYGDSPSAVDAFNVTTSTVTRTYSISAGSNGEDLEISADGSTFSLAAGGGNGSGSGYATDTYSVADGTAHSNVTLQPTAFAFSRDNTTAFGGQNLNDAINVYTLSRDSSGVLDLGAQTGTVTAANPAVKLYSDTNGDLFVNEGTETEIFANNTSSSGGGTSGVNVSVGLSRTLREGHTKLTKTDVSFTDSTGTGPYTATVDYGDGTGLHVLTIGAGNTLSLVHDYPGHVSHTYVAYVTVYSRTSSSRHAFDVTVINDPPHDLTITPTAGHAITNASPFLATASFVDAGAGNGDFFRVYVNYGDGTKILRETLTTASVPISHQYTHKGIYKLTVTVIDDGGGQQVVSKNITVATAPVKKKTT